MFHHKVFITSTDPAGIIPTTTRVLSEFVSRDPTPSPRILAARREQRRAAKTPGRPVTVHLILPQSFAEWRKTHPLAGDLKVGDTFKSCVDADAHLGLSPGRLSQEFAKVRAEGAKKCCLPYGVVWGYVDEKVGAL